MTKHTTGIVNYQIYNQKLIFVRDFQRIFTNSSSRMMFPELECIMSLVLNRISDIELNTVTYKIDCVKTIVIIALKALLFN